MRYLFWGGSARNRPTSKMMVFIIVSVSFLCSNATWRRTLP